jgi:hypothetical protein
MLRGLDILKSPKFKQKLVQFIISVYHTNDTLLEILTLESFR